MQTKSCVQTGTEEDRRYSIREIKEVVRHGEGLNFLLPHLPVHETGRES